MVPETSATTPAETTDDEESNTLLNAFIGAIAGVLLSFVPLSTLLGGAVAGYLEGGDGDAGVKVGAIAGVIMLVPLVFIGFFAMAFVIGAGPGGAPRTFGPMLIVALLFGAIYTVGLSVLGGYLGVYVKNDL